MSSRAPALNEDRQIASKAMELVQRMRRLCCDHEVPEKAMDVRIEKSTVFGKQRPRCVPLVL